MNKYLKFLLFFISMIVFYILTGNADLSFGLFLLVLYLDYKFFHPKEKEKDL